MKFKRGQSVRLAGGVDGRLGGEVGTVIGIGRDGGTRKAPATPYVVVGWSRGSALGGSAYAPAQLIAIDAPAVETKVAHGF